jgi:hypothetical protein
MKTTEIHEFLTSLGFRYSPEGLEHYMRILQLIAHKMLNPEIPESSFITAVFNEDWEKAKSFADKRNKEALINDIFQKFVAHVKKSPQYISKRREDKLNKLFNE